MRKINFILLLLILSTGCSLNRIGRTVNYEKINESNNNRILDDLFKQNITSQGFFIEKAEIEVRGQEGTEKLIGSVKFKKPGMYSMSVKSRTGIEAARIFLTDDTILINDRFNRKQFCGSPNYLKNKYGITSSILPIIFGDYIGNCMSGNIDIECLDGKLDKICNIEGVIIRYIIDCNKRKSILAIGESNLSSQGIEIQYKEFFKKGGILIPGEIEIKDLKNETTIKIEIKKIESPWDGIVEFVPGNRYEIIQLR